MKKWMPVWVWPLLIFFSVATVWLRLSAVKTTLAIHEYDKRIKDLNRDIEKLRLSLAQLRSPKRLEALAKKFQLEPPKPEQLIWIQTEHLAHPQLEKP